MYYGIKVQLEDCYKVISCVSEAAALELHSLVEACRVPVYVLFNTEPITAGTVEFKPSSLRHYELDCGCDITDWDGRIKVDHCGTEECCDPALCLSHPNFFTREFTLKHGVKTYV